MSVRQQTVLERLRVKNFRSLVDVDLSFDRLVVLVGANGSGKSTVIDVVRFVRDALTRSLDDAILDRSGIASIRRWSPRGAPDVSIQLWLRGANWEAEYSFVIGSEQRGAWRVKAENLLITQTPSDHVGEYVREQPTLEFHIKEGKLDNTPEGLDHIARLPALISTSDLLMPKLRLLSFMRAPDEMYRFFADMSFHTIYPNSLREPQKPGNDYPLEERGQNLASVLRSFQQNHDSYALLNDALGRVVEGVSSYTVQLIGGFLVTRLQHTPTEGGRRGPAFDLSQESDGTLRMLGILTALYQEPARSILTIEEPELTIHPGALGVLCDVILEASARSQVIVTTHSPDLIDRFPTDSLRVVDKQDGVTSVGPVSDDQRAVIAQHLFSPGELLRIEGLQREDTRKGSR